MVKINTSEFGSITIDNKKYPHDVYIFPSGKVEERPHSHSISKDQVEHILKENSDLEVIFIGKGTSGMASLDADARELLEKKGIEIIEANTPDIKDKFNELADKREKKIAAIIHTTC